IPGKRGLGECGIIKPLGRNLFSEKRYDTNSSLPVPVGFHSMPPSQLRCDACDECDRWDECDKSRPIGASSGILKGEQPQMARPNNTSYAPGPETPGHSRAWESSTVMRCLGRSGGRKVERSGRRKTM